MATLTWSFTSGPNGWSQRDESSGDPASFNVITYDGGAEALQQEAFVPAVAGSLSRGWAISPQINAAVINGDTIEMDVSILTGAPLADTTRRVKAIYSDATSEEQTAVGQAAITLTLTMTAAKTLDHIELVAVEVGNGGAPTSFDLFCDILEVRLITATAVTATAGKLRTPQSFIEDEGAGAAGGAGGGSGGNIASMSSDGLFIYIASFNNLGFPTLIKISAVLTADGTVVFDPGDGGRIGVQCGKYNEEHLWIAGQFDGTNTVEKSEDAGANFTVKDDASFGAIRTFEIGPDTDERVIIFDGDNGDIIETLDDGATWTDHNTAVTPLVNSIARFNESPAEIVAGNEGAANDSINYSPNSGANLADYQTGVYPATDATKVIAN